MAESLFHGQLSRMVVRVVGGNDRTNTAEVLEGAPFLRIIERRSPGDIDRGVGFLRRVVIVRAGYARPLVADVSCPDDPARANLPLERQIPGRDLRYPEVLLHVIQANGRDKRRLGPRNVGSILCRERAGNSDAAPRVVEGDIIELSRTAERAGQSTCRPMR